MSFQQEILVLYMIVCIATGFILTSKGTLMTERVKTWASIIACSNLVVFIILAVVWKSVVLAMAAVVFYFMYTRIGQIIALLITGKARSIGPLSWIMVVLAVIVTYCTVAGRIVEISEEAASPPPVSVSTGVSVQERNYVASRNSGKYHRVTCDHADRILSENRIYYETAAEAEQAGKDPCSVCRP